MTSNEKPEATPEWVTRFYNGRGDSEKDFDILNNDFNCNRLPFSLLDANMFYQFIVAMGFTLFGWIKQAFFNKGVIENTTMRCKNFFMRIYNTASQVDKDRQARIYKIFTTRTCYKPLFE